MVVLVATSNHHQAHAYTCVDVQATLSLTCDGCLGGVLGLVNGLLGGGWVQGLLPGGQCCANVKICRINVPQPNWIFKLVYQFAILAL
ncbi:hypothetical protein SLA2020_154290 [Shorea laevis]